MDEELKKYVGLIIVSIIVFILFIKFFWWVFGSGMYSFEGGVEKASFDSEGNIVIINEEVYEQPTYIVYTYGGVHIGLIAIKNSKGKVMVIVNTCQSCEPSPNAYFMYKKGKLQGISCGNTIEIDELENVKEDSCYPIRIEDRRDEDGKTIIGTKQLDELKDRFVNWNGPKL